MIDFRGQVAVVTGGGRGLGRLYALELARRGASVVVNDLGSSSRGLGSDKSVSAQVVEEIKAAGGEAVASTDNVSSPEGGKAIIEAALHHFGRIDAVINNAGIVQFTPFEEVTLDEWRGMLSVHLDGAFNVSQPAFRAMKRQGYGRFVFISSTAGMLGYPGNSNYGAAKAGIVGFANVLSLEGASHGVTANSVLPTGHSRMVTDNAGDAISSGQKGFYAAIRPELITPLVVYLASRACTVSHRNYAAFAGRYARVFVGYGEGWLSDEGATPTVEDIEARIDVISATTKFSVPEGQVDELLEICAQRGINLMAP